MCMSTCACSMCMWYVRSCGMCMLCMYVLCSFSGLEKDVLMLTKTTGDQPFSCFMGKGIIPLTPQFVFNSLRNPQLRFMYDNMLKVLPYPLIG